jgi:tetratricopeptide (TPR) repeat protein
MMSPMSVVLSREDSMPSDSKILIRTSSAEGTDAAIRRSNAASALNLAESHRLARCFDEAEGVLVEAIEAFPEHPSLLICHAWVAQQGGRLEDALERWARVRIVARNNPIGYSAAVQVHQKLGQYHVSTPLESSADPQE